MHELGPDRRALTPLYTEHRHLRAIREAVLEGRLGRAWADRSEAPRAARLDLGCYGVFGGDPASPEAARMIADVNAPLELVYPDAHWRRRILEIHGEKVRDRPMEGFSAAHLDASRLRDLARRLDDGYVVRRLDAASAQQLDGGLVPHGLQTYPTPETLAGDGMGWGAFAPNGPGELASAATSYARSSRSVEVAISTRPEHRGRGLATAVAARFLLDALEQGLVPCWNASNPVSKHLARRLGFKGDGECEILFLED